MGQILRLIYEAHTKLIDVDLDAVTTRVVDGVETEVVLLGTEPPRIKDLPVAELRDKEDPKLGEDFAALMRRVERSLRRRNEKAIKDPDAVQKQMNENHHTRQAIRRERAEAEKAKVEAAELTAKANAEAEAAAKARAEAEQKLADANAKLSAVKAQEARDTPADASTK